MKLQRTVAVGKPLNAVFDYLSDFTTTTEWDPGTVTTVRQHGNGGTGTTYLNTSRFLGRTTQLTYVVEELADQQTSWTTAASLRSVASRRSCGASKTT